MVARAVAAAARAIGASRDEAAVLASAALRPSLAGSPLWFALPPAAAPSASAPLGDLLAFCADAVAAPRDVAGLGAVVGLIHEIYAAHGWAVSAARAAAGESSLPADLATVVTARARARFVVDTASMVAACPPDLAALVAIAAVPPGGDLVHGALAKMVETFALMTSMTPVDRELDGLLSSLHELGRHEWTWDAVDAWCTGDPLIVARTLARDSGFAGVLERVGGELAELVTELVATTWREAIERTQRAAAITAADPLADAILELADAAAERAAERLGAIARTHWQGGSAEPIAAVCGELLGDPREIRTLWEAHAPAIRAALEHG